MRILALFTVMACVLSMASAFSFGGFFSSMASSVMGSLQGKLKLFDGESWMQTFEVMLAKMSEFIGHFGSLVQEAFKQMSEKFQVMKGDSSIGKEKYKELFEEFQKKVSGST